MTRGAGRDQVSSVGRVHFHHTPTSASWLNQVGGFFGILGKQSLGIAHHTLFFPLPDIAKA